MPVPAYLGQVLIAGTATATCFQVSPGILVTALHVLEGDVLVEPLAGGLPVPASVVREDPQHDLAVLRISEPFRSCVTLSATDAAELTTPAVVTGVSEVDDQHVYGHLDAVGIWAGGVTRDGIRLGRLSSKDVVPGMSGAPVRRVHDNVVIGVVSGRYNSVDGWLRDSVWVAQIEDLQPLLAGVAEVHVGGRPVGRVVDLRLEVSESAVRLSGPGIDITAEHGGVTLGLKLALGEVRRAGQLLAESFLPDSVRSEFARVLCRAEAEDAVVQIGVDAPHFASLPWEALTIDDRPLALRRSVVVYRKAAALPLRQVPGPLRIVVAIASPDNGGRVLDYERELRNVLAAVRGARAGDAQVRIVPFATTKAIRKELMSGPTHVLHLSGHGEPGVLHLENEEGSVREVTVETFVDEAIPSGAMPPVVALSACHTHEPPSFSAGLIQRGASVVIGAEKAVTDQYSTRLFARIYNELATAATPDVIGAVAEARRLVQIELSSTDDDRHEWSVITVHAATGTAPLFDPTKSEKLSAPTRQSLRGLLDRAIGEFVGRRHEQRELPALLLGPTTSGVILHGIGGIGKTTLAAQLVRRIQDREPTYRAVILTGELLVDSIFTKVAVVLRQNNFAKVAEHVGRLDERWQDRFDYLREWVLDNLPLLIILDNFEENLADNEIPDATLASLLAEWSRDPGRSRLLITSRRPFALPAMTIRQVGPMSLGETKKLIWSLPALDKLDSAEQELAWRMVGGHPRTLEYLDALLAHGQARFPNVTERLATAIGKDALRSTPTLHAALTQSITLAANDILLDELLATLPPEADRLLLDLSVYREPIPAPDDVSLLEASNLVTVADGSAFVHRWTASELARHWTERNRDDQLRGSHRKAAEYWQGRVGLTHDPATDIHDSLEARYHLLAAGYRPQAAAITEPVCALLHQVGAFDWESELVHDTLQWLDPDSPKYPTWVYQLGLVALARSEYEEAERRHRQALEMDRRHGNQEGIARNYHHLGILAYVRGKYTEAEKLYRLALDIHEQLGNQPGMAAEHIQLGELAKLRGDQTEAERRLQQALRICEHGRNLAGMATCYHNLAVLAALRDDLPEAESRCRQSLAIEEQLGNQAGMAVSYHELGMIEQSRGELDEAERLFLQALKMKERLGDRAAIATTVSQFGCLASARGQPQDAVRFHLRALEIRRELQVPQAYYDAKQLLELRERLGRAEFDHLAESVLDPKQAAELNRYIDSFPKKGQKE